MSSAPQGLRWEALATGRLRFRLPDHREVCAGERVVVYSQARRFALHTHPFPWQAERGALSCTGGREKDRRMREGQVDTADAYPAPKQAQTFSRCSLHEPLGDSSSQKPYEQRRTRSNFYPGGKNHWK